MRRRCKILWDALSAEYDADHGIHRDLGRPWAVGIIDPLDAPSFQARHAAAVAVSVVAPWWHGGRGVAFATGMSRPFAMGLLAFLFYAWPIFLIANLGQAGLWALGWLCYVGFACTLGFSRFAARNIRVRYSVPSMPITASRLRLACFQTTIMPALRSIACLLVREMPGLSRWLRHHHAAKIEVGPLASSGQTSERRHSVSGRS